LANHLRYQDLRVAMTDRHGQINQKSFGWKLMRHRNRICNGWRIEVVTDSTQARASTYRLKAVISPGVAGKKAG
jgi:hypothetical protein